MAPGTVGHAVKGLEGVVVADTALSYIDGGVGRLVFRGYDAAHLAEQYPFEAIWHLLFEGSLPVATGLAAYAVMKVN